MKKRLSGEELKREVKQAIIKGITNGKQKKARAHIHKPIVYGLSVLAAAIGLLLGTAYLSPTMTHELSRIPVLGSVFTVSQDERLKKASENGLTTPLLQPQTIGDVSITLNEALYDQTHFSLLFTIESEQTLKEEDYQMRTLSLVINEKEFTEVSGGGSSSTGDPNKHIVRYEFEVRQDEEIPEAFDLGIVWDLDNGDSFFFSTPIKQLDYTELAVNYDQEVSGIELEVHALTLSKSATNLTYTVVNQEEINQSFDFKLRDQDGKFISPSSGKTSSAIEDGNWILSGEARFNALDASVKSLHITPVLNAITEDDVTEDDTDNVNASVSFEPFEVIIP
ncbi:DUF4179 domain-containing protein [Shouchella patagoniensis]|uniref:DUF4179 domain-containing protein n=1 Tax=Shouchella patagoniensis TaxID=228576 RepID=UPI00099513E2|nr:DUF4179 domain-containing protein [Shouchella patagoniensis]